MQWSMHHVDFFFFALTFSDVVCPWVFLFSLLSLFCFSFPTICIMVRKTRAHRTSTSSSTPSFHSERFCSKKNQETYEKLNILRTMWAERKVVLDEFDPEIRRNFEQWG